MTPDELHETRTSDGWRIVLSRWRASGPGRGLPVLLCHGLGSTAESFDMDPACSLARHLAAQGRDVWAVDLRGHGRSEHPSRKTGKRWGWTFDDFLDKDLPAALALVREKTATAECQYIGHSMGGLALMSYLARGGNGIRSGVTIGSTLDYSRSPSDFRTLLRLKFLLRLLPYFPFGPLARLFAPLSCRFANPFDAFNVQWTNIDPKVYRRFMASGVESASSGVLKQLSTAFDPGGLRSSDGLQGYFGRLGAVKTPILFITGDVDRQCSIEGARHSYEALGASDKELASFGLAFGQSDHYGHVDLVMGLRAPREVYPAIDRWLDRHDA